MITEDYVSFEVAKLLRESGFDVETYASIKVFAGHNYEVNGERITPEKDTIIPTLQMAIKWLREKHKIDITIDPHEVGINWIYQFHICQNKKYLFSRDIDTSYENCAEAAIKYCLKNLI